MNRTVLFFTARDAIQMMRTAVICLWPITTLAAGASLGTTFGQVTAADWLSLITLSFVSGLVALLYRVRKSLEAAAKGQLDSPDLQVISWKVFALCHLAGAMFAGAMGFFACEFFDLNSWLEALAIATSSWSGAKAADRWADMLNDGLLRRASDVFSRKD